MKHPPLDSWIINLSLDIPRHSQHVSLSDESYLSWRPESNLGVALALGPVPNLSFGRDITCTIWFGVHSIPIFLPFSWKHKSQGRPETMAIPNGQYTLRASPVVGLGGMFATGNGVDETVSVAAHKPPFLERQIWNIHAVKGKENVYTITRHTDGRTHGGSWSPKDKPAPGVPIVISEEVVEWYIGYLPIKVPEAITIQATTSSELLYVGTDNNKKVVFKAVPPWPELDVPYWQLKAHHH